MNRKQLLTMKVSEDEKARWHKLAAGHGVSLSELIRRRLDDLPLPETSPRRRPRPAPKADPKLIFQVAAIGNNLNQLARRVNAGQLLELAELKHISDQLAQLLEECGGRSDD